MAELFTNNPWLVVCVLVALVIVACTAIVFLTEHLRVSRQAEIDAALKHQMVERGMTAADIKTILEASTDGEALRTALEADQGVRLGLGKFQLELGNRSPRSAESPTRG
jgi:hypothetical protein